MTLEFSGQDLEIKYSKNFTKIGPVGAELFHVDGRTDMKRPRVAFRNFANALKKLKYGSNGLSY
jgi:hypothetical protein